MSSAATARPLTDVPPELVAQAVAPCAFYSCVSEPQIHTNWQNTVGALPFDYCKRFKCSPMDLIATNGLDDNLFPKDPDWAYFIQTGQLPDANQLCGQFTTGPLGNPPCTSQPVDYDAAGVSTLAYAFCPLGRSPYLSFHGHVNWEPGTYEGTLTTFDHSGFASDDEYSLDLATVGGHGATAARTSGIHIEFDSDETIDHFDVSPWWKKWHNAVDHDQGLAVVKGDLAVVTGLLGLDTVHGPALESHPVYATAIDTDRAAALAGKEDTWAMFARNWGNEGYCSQNHHSIPPGKLTVRIPWLNKAVGVGAGALIRPATGVEVTNTSDLWSNINPHGAMSITVIPQEGILVSYDLSHDPSGEPEYWGTIGLKWSFGPPQATTVTPPVTSVPAAPTARTAPAVDGEKSDVEVIAERLFRKLRPAVRAKARASIPHPSQTFRASRVKINVGSPPVIPLRRADAFLPPTRDAAQVALGRAQAKAVCVAYHRSVPGLPKRTCH